MLYKSALSDHAPVGTCRGFSSSAHPATRFCTHLYRFTVAGDAVLGIGVESTQLLEVALDRGRPVELFLVNSSLVAEVRGRMEKAFQQAFMSGRFKVHLATRTKCCTIFHYVLSPCCHGRGFSSPPGGRRPYSLFHSPLHLTLIPWGSWIKPHTHKYHPMAQFYMGLWHSCFA